MAQRGRPRSTIREKVGAPLRLFEHQARVVEKYKEGIRRFFLAWHRRAGKDVFGLDFARERMQERVGNYWHCFPFHVQARRAIWKGIDARTGERFIDRAFYNRVKAKDNETEMSITMPNGSTWQMLGSDNYDRAVGANPCGLMFSEWALCDPAAWEYFRPILVENKGWAAFITTFRGRNHAWRMFDSLKHAEGWYVDLRTIDQTRKHDGSPIVSKEDVEKEIREGMDPALAQQEFYCDPEAASAGAIFARQNARLLAMHAQPFSPNSRVLRVGWGFHEEGISAVAFQDRHIVSVNPFLEINLADCVQAMARRHPNMQLVHHAKNPDPQLFQSLDGHGIVDVKMPAGEHMKHGHVAALLDSCHVTAPARETLADFAMSYAPYREVLDEQLTHASLSEALAVTNLAQWLNQDRPRKPLNYSQYDRGVI